MNFAEKILRGPINRMKDVYRYSSYPVIKHESVAEHSYYVALYALLINCELNLRLTESKLLRRAILHDIDESMTGDFVRSFKHSDPNLHDKLHQAAGLFASKLLSSIMSSDGQATLLLDDWYECKDDTLEGDLIAVADYASVIQYILRELELGNRMMIAIAYECEVYGHKVLQRVTLDSLRNLVEEMTQILLKARRNHESQAAYEYGRYSSDIGHDLAGEQD